MDKLQNSLKTLTAHIQFLGQGIFWFECCDRVLVLSVILN
jgi:hypothetical protein